MLNSIFALASFFITGIYSFQYSDIDGNTVQMSSFENKKILLVNIATGSPRVNQLSGLEQLHQQYGDSLVIIAFPSNSFGNESRTNAEIKSFCQSNYGVSFRIASKNPVAGTGIQSIYNWLAQSSENGVMNGTVGGDFQKFLINKEGNIIGNFGPSVPLNDNALIEAITQN